MNLDPHEVGLVRQYLLGLLPEEDRRPIEERLLADGDFFEEILISEEELIDDYVSHQLSESEVQAFETNFLVIPERRKQLRFARRLAKYVGEDSEAAEEVGKEVSTEPSSAPTKDSSQKRNFFSFFPSLSPALSYSLAAVILLAFVGISWLVVTNSLDSPRPGKTLAITLSPGLTRDGGVTDRVNLSPDIEQVAIGIVIPKPGYQVYRTRLLADDKSQLWVSGDLTATEDAGASTTTPATTGTRVVVSTIPARLLVPGDYRITLSGRANDGSFEELATNSFRVPR